MKQEYLIPLSDGHLLVMLGQWPKNPLWPNMIRRSDLVPQSKAVAALMLKKLNPNMKGVSIPEVVKSNPIRLKQARAAAKLFASRYDPQN